MAWQACGRRERVVAFLDLELGTDIELFLCRFGFEVLFLMLLGLVLEGMWIGLLVEALPRVSWGCKRIVSMQK